MTQASIETYIEQEHLGELKRKRELVLEYIIRNPDCTLIDIKRDLKMIHQSASSVVSVLKFTGKVFVTGTVKVPSGTNKDKTRTHSSWRYEPSMDKQEQRHLQERLLVVKSMAKRMANDFPDLVTYFSQQVERLNSGEGIGDTGQDSGPDDDGHPPMDFTEGQMELF